MPTSDLVNNLYMVLGFIVPGFIILSVRSQFVTGREPHYSNAFLLYLIVTIVYYALVLPFVTFVLAIDEPGICKTLAWFVLVFVGPAIFGILLALNIQYNFFRRILQRLRLNPVHGMPTAWDWKFGGMATQWVLVTLKDGKTFAGYCGPESFASSDPRERDIYIQWIYDIADDKKWSTRGENGVLITAGEIQTIEFWPYTPKEDPND